MKSLLLPPLRLALCQVAECPPAVRRITDVQPDWHHVIALAADEPVALGSGGNLLLLPAQEAAKARLHPLALLQGLGRGRQGAAEALAQARRSAADAVICRLPLTTAAVIKHAKLLAERTHPDHGGYWHHPRHLARVLLLQDEDSLVLTQGTERIQLNLNGGELPWLLPIALRSVDAADIQHQLSLVQASLSDISSTQALQRYIQACFGVMTPGCRALVLLGSNAGALALEAEALASRIPDSIESGQTVATPSGSLFCPQGTGPDALAFVYPGVGTVSPTMLVGLHRYFPDTFDKLNHQCRRHGLKGLDGILLPDRLVDSPTLAEQAVAGVGASYVLAQILMNELALSPRLALGYSMGEAAMMACHNRWQDPFAMVGDTLKSDIFNRQLSGELTQVRRQWGLDAASPLHWQSLLLRLDAETIRPRLGEYPRVSIAISQGPSTVLAGDSAELQCLQKALGKRGLTSPLVTAMHTPAAASLEADLRDFYHREITQPARSNNGQPKLLSAGAKPLDTSADGMAAAIARTFTRSLDFGHLIRRAHDAGARLFVEVGAGRQTCTFIDGIAAAASLNLCSLPCDGQGGKVLQKTLATLIANGVPMQLSRLCPQGAG